MKEAGRSLDVNHDMPERTDDFISKAEVGICVTNFHTCRILFANDKMASYAGKSDAASMIGGVCCANLNPEGKNRCPFCLHNKLIDKQRNPLEPHIKEFYLKKSGIWLKVINQSVAWSNGQLIRVVTFYDITETKKMREQFAKCMSRDRLLGLKNDDVLEYDIRIAETKPSLLLVDILSIRKINEFYGKKIGDEVLYSIRDWILSRDIPDSELYRIGGGRFCFAVKNMDAAGIKKLANGLFQMFEEPWVFERDGKGMWVFCTASIAVLPGKYIKESESLTGMIERTLARAKEGKEAVVYSEKTDKAYKDRLKLEWSLKKCIHENMLGFEIHYQPIVDSASGVWCRLEALCRWNSPELGALSPKVFIPEAERLALIGTLGIWVLETAICKCKTWGLDRCDHFVLNVNLSADQFLDEALSGNIIDIIEKYHFPGEKLCLEITESTGVTFANQSLQAIEELRAHKVLVALDDFGTGYSSFSRLKSIPVDIIKIERIFVADIENNEYHRYLFRTMTKLAHAADMELVVEGVERERQMNILAEDGADYFQGFLFGKPLPPCEIEKELHRFYGRHPENNYFAEENSVQEAVI